MCVTSGGLNVESTGNAFIEFTGGHFGMHPNRYGSGIAKELHLYQLFAFDINSVGFPFMVVSGEI